MRGWGALLAAAAVLVVASGCDGVEAAETEAAATDGAGGPVATPGSVLLLVDVNPEPLCNTVGVTAVQLVARRVGCETAPPAPCTVPAEPPRIEGDLFTCPNTDPSTLMGVEVEQGGRYEVQTVIEFTTGESEARCNARDADPEILVAASAVEAGAVIMLDDADVPCP